MAKSYLIRQAQDLDIPAIRVLANSAYKKLSDMGLNYTASYQDENQTKKRMDQGRAFVLEQNQEIIGTVLFTATNFFTKRHSGYISQLAIQPSLQGSGLGTVLMDYCEELARQEGFEAVQLDTAKPATHLVNWYLKRGYRVVGETKWDGKTYESYVFEKICPPPSKNETPAFSPPTFVR